MTGQKTGNKQALITLCHDEISPRFDMTTEVLVFPIGKGEHIATEEPRHLVLAHMSSEELCDLIIRSGVSLVVCGGIEEDYFHYLRWKRIEVLCDVMGAADIARQRALAGDLAAGDCLYPTEKEAE